MDRARAENMPNDNIERAIKRGTGEDKDGSSLDQVTYEGFGPNGVAIMVETVTDNRNRTVGELRHVLTRYGGNLGESGSVAWQFNRVAFFAFAAGGRTEEQIFELALEAGADDVWVEDGAAEITGPVESFKRIGDALRAAKITIDDAGLRMQAKQEIELSPEDSIQAMRAIEALEELDDVQTVAYNLSLSDQVLEKLSA
jgi:YebC/PmpR family DNA-binding regulatory protein